MVKFETFIGSLSPVEGTAIVFVTQAFYLDCSVLEP